MTEESILVKTFIINNNEYYVVNEIDYNNKHYVYLSNKLDSTDMMIRIVKDDILLPLDSEEELFEVLKLIAK